MLNPTSIDPLSLPSVPVADRKQLPEVPCIYFAIDSTDAIQYIGRSVNPRRRWQTHHREPQVKECRIAYMQCDEALLDQVEQALIEWFQPMLNRTDVAKTLRQSMPYYLYEISKALGRSGERELRTVAQLRKREPDISRAYPRLGLAELAELADRLARGETIAAPVAPRGRKRQCLLSDAEIVAMAAAGQSLSKIGEAAGVSRQRISQIVGKLKKEVDNDG